MVMPAGASSSVARSAALLRRALAQAAHDAEHADLVRHLGLPDAAPPDPAPATIADQIAHGPLSSQRM